MKPRLQREPRPPQMKRLLHPLPPLPPPPATPEEAPPQSTYPGSRVSPQRRQRGWSSRQRPSCPGGGGPAPGRLGPCRTENGVTHGGGRPGLQPLPLEPGPSLLLCPPRAGTPDGHIRLPPHPGGGQQAFLAVRPGAPEGRGPPDASHPSGSPSPWTMNHREAEGL